MMMMMIELWVNEAGESEKAGWRCGGGAVRNSNLTELKLEKHGVIFKETAARWLANDGIVLWCLLDRVEQLIYTAEVNNEWARRGVIDRCLRTKWRACKSKRSSDWTYAAASLVQIFSVGKKIRIYGTTLEIQVWKRLLFEPVRSVEPNGSRLWSVLKGRTKTFDEAAEIKRSHGHSLPQDLRRAGNPFSIFSKSCLNNLAFV